ncbi:MarR family transcriptional regulator [Novosphingobium sp. CF614]|uniref:MarR family transcriptional regulator n=1 Tax=Novosphingobium sp. CF614 TaxID=1884364 RepID=UPI0015A5F795|nr:MarR family transcriptional regulator [Novosphingobium sp. CF614]
MTFATSQPTIDQRRDTQAGSARLQGEGKCVAMSEVAKDNAMPTKRMKILADELNSLISRMEMSEIYEDDSDDIPSTPTIEDWLETAVDTYNMRRHREKVFGMQQLFGEPTWDILLDLFIAELRTAKIQTTSACIGAQVPQTTALRWIALLERENLVRRYRDKDDSRRVYIQLTDLALRKMVEIFYDKCFLTMNKKKYSLSRLGKLNHGTSEYNEAKEIILADTISQIKIRRNGEAN